MDMSLKGPNEVHSVTADADVSIQPLAVMPAPQSEALLPSTSSILTHQVMTDEQLGTLRCQISAYATICQRLVEMHKTIMAQQTAISGLRLGQSNPFDPAMHAVGQKLTSRQRWTPSQTQLQILEKLFEQGNGTPNKQRIKEITTELSQHGQISETNVYNWFQNRRARTKRKQQLGVSNNGESEADTDVDSPPEKKVKMEIDLSHEIFGPGKSETSILSTEGALADTNSTAVLNRAVTAGENGYGSGSYGGEAVLVNGKAREVPALMMEIKNNIVGVSGLEDSQGQRVSNSGFGVPLKFPYSSERLGNGVMTAATMSSEGILNPSLQQATGIKREGLNSGSLVHTYSQSQFRG